MGETFKKWQVDRMTSWSYKSDKLIIVDWQVDDKLILLLFLGSMFGGISPMVNMMKPMLGDEEE